MTYGGNGKKRTIRVSRNMDVEQEFKIPARNSFVWPWQREYDASPVGFSMGYVTKQWVTSGEGARLKEDVWGRENKRLHGLQVGLHFQPCFSWGLGLYSGLFYEYYMSWNEEMKEQGYMDHFQEHCLYMPIHAYYRLPLPIRWLWLFMAVLALIMDFMLVSALLNMKTLNLQLNIMAWMAGPIVLTHRQKLGLVFE